MAIVGVILFILSIIGLLVSLFMKDEDSGKYGYRKYSVIPCVTLVIGIVLTCMATVPKGHVGVEMQFNAVTGQYKTQGLQFKSPLVKFHNMSIQTQKYSSPASAVSYDLQTVNTEITVDYHLSPDYAAEVYRDIGDNYINTIAVQAIQETVKQITAEYKAEDLIKKRPEVKAQIVVALSDRLGTRGIVVETVSLTDFQFSPVFDAAIEAKMVAEQDVLKAENELRRIEVEARQAEQKAEGEANAVIKEAEGQAKAIEIVTAAKVQANLDLQDTLTPEVLRYLLINEIGDDITVMLLPEGQGLDLLIPEIPTK